MEIARNLSMVLRDNEQGNFKMKKKVFKYWGNGYWRSRDKLGRVSGFYTWRQIIMFHNKGKVR